MRFIIAIFLAVVAASGVILSKPSDVCRPCDVARLVRDVLGMTSREPPFLNVDTYIQLARVVSHSNGSATKAHELCRFADQTITTLADPEIKGIFWQRLAETYALVDLPEAEEWARSLPSRPQLGTYVDYKSRVYNAILRAAAARSQSAGLEQLKDGLRGGAIQAELLPAALHELARTSSADAAALFDIAVRAFPTSSMATDLDVLALLNAAREIVTDDKRLVSRAIDVMLPAVMSKDFGVHSPQDITGTFVVGTRSVQTRSTRDTVLMQIAHLAQYADVLSRYEQQLGAYVDVSSGQQNSLAIPRDVTFRLKTQDESEDTILQREAMSDVIASLPVQNAFEQTRALPSLDERCSLFATLLKRDDLGTSRAPIEDEALSTVLSVDKPSRATMSLAEAVLLSAVEVQNMALATKGVYAFTKTARGFCDVSYSSSVTTVVQCLDMYNTLARSLVRQPALFRAVAPSLDASLLIRTMFACNGECTHQPGRQ